MNDRIIRATAAKFPFRFVLVDLTRTSNHIGQLHNARAHALSILSEVAMSSILLASGLKFPGTVSLSMELSGDLSYVHADSTPMGLVRAMIPQEEVRKAGDFELLISPLRMRVRRINEKGKTVQESIVEALSPQMGPNLAAFMMQSEQVRSAVGIFSKLHSNDDTRLDYAVAFLVEAFPSAKDQDLEVLDQAVRSLPPIEHFIGPQGVSLEEILQSISGDFETEIVREIHPQHYCPCSKVRTLATLATIPTADLHTLAQENQELEIICDYCRTRYHVSSSEVREIIDQREHGDPRSNN